MNTGWQNHPLNICMMKKTTTENINPDYVESIRKIIGEWMREFRTELNITQSELAEKLGITEGTVSKMEAGKWLSLEMLIKVSITLDFFIFLCPKNSNDDLATIMRHRHAIMRDADKEPS